ncbi:MAG: type II toxin-antitoxin system VapC family toxin [Acidobacteria bacterium]|nr:MAG: type II toxin-antitoxin system VapC family toxin [Acidobacteriota bacterium]
MLLLDTNMLSALMQPVLPVEVLRLREIFARERVVTGAVCEAEVLAGIAAMPEGRRRQALERDARLLFERRLAGDVLPFDRAAAAEYAVLFGQCRRAGTPIEAPDMMIAAIARVHGATVVTRNARHFEPCGVDILDPWEGQG